MKINKRLDFFVHVILRQLPFFYIEQKGKLGSVPQDSIIGLIRERNESLLLKDTLDHLSQFVDGIVVFDDDSTDDSVDIALRHPAVLRVIKNKKWNSKNRAWEETANRRKLHNTAKKYTPKWFFYADADERFEGDIKQFLKNSCPDDVNAIRISLLDAYITNDDKKPFGKDEKLYNFRKYYGPERRDIIMIWRNIVGVEYKMRDAREPQNISGKQITEFHCQHYGKALSVDHWEQTCDYYMNFFPKYAEKWKARKGKAVHDKSDFGNPLYSWEIAKTKSVKL
jgi:glycosyltransferase involved in cell wall biosynthesis